MTRYEPTASVMLQAASSPLGGPGGWLPDDADRA